MVFICELVEINHGSSLRRISIIILSIRQGLQTRAKLKKCMKGLPFSISMFCI